MLPFEIHFPTLLILFPAIALVDFSLLYLEKEAQMTKIYDFSSLWS